MRHRRLGKSDLQVSEVSFGGHQTGGYRGHFKVPVEQRVEVIRRGLDLGITYFDTTTRHEVESLGAVFQRLGGKPDGVTVACMYTDYKRNHEIVEGIEQRVRESIEDNLRHFETIDVFNLCGNGFPYSRERTLRALDALEESRQQGLVGHFGFSTHTMHYAQDMITNHPEFTLVMFPFNCVLPGVATRLFPLARQHDVAVVGMKALAARGFLNLDMDLSRFGDGLSLPVAAIKWVLGHQDVACTIPAMNSIEEVEQNVTASGTPLLAQEADLLEALQDAFERRVSTDEDWYFHRDWTRRLYGEDWAPGDEVAGNDFD